MLATGSRLPPSQTYLSTYDSRYDNGNPCLMKPPAPADCPKLIVARFRGGLVPVGLACVP